MKTKCPFCGAPGFSSTKCSKCSRLIPEPKVIKKEVVKKKKPFIVYLDDDKNKIEE